MRIKMFWRKFVGVPLGSEVDVFVIHKNQNGGMAGHETGIYMGKSASGNDHVVRIVRSGELVKVWKSHLVEAGGRFTAFVVYYTGDWRSLPPVTFGDTAPTNAAFEDYRAKELKRLEQEAAEFALYVDKLRRAKDLAEFQEWMISKQAKVLTT